MTVGDKKTVQLEPISILYDIKSNIQYIANIISNKEVWDFFND